MNIKATFSVLQQGKALANPAMWRVVGGASAVGIGSAAYLSDTIAQFSLAADAVIQGLFGYDLHITEPIARGFGVFVASGVGLYFAIATSDKLGLAPKVDGESGGPTASGTPQGGEGGMRPADPPSSGPQSNNMP